MKQAKRKIKVTNTGRQAYPEPKPSTRLEELQKALKRINFGFTIFFADENGQSIKYYQGAVVQENI